MCSIQLVLVYDDNHDSLVWLLWAFVLWWIASHYATNVITLCKYNYIMYILHVMNVHLYVCRSMQTNKYNSRDIGKKFDVTMDSKPVQMKLQIFLQL